MKLLLKGLPSTSTDESLVNFLEILTDADVHTLYTSASSVVVEIDVVIDTQRLNEKCMRKQYLNCTLVAEEWQLKALHVSSLTQQVSSEVLELYFSNTKRSGGGEVDGVKRSRAGDSALVIFKHEKDAQNVLRADSHRVEGCYLVIQPYLGSRDSLEQVQQDILKIKAESGMGQDRLSQSAGHHMASSGQPLTGQNRTGETVDPRTTERHQFQGNSRPYTMGHQGGHPQQELPQGQITPNSEEILPPCTVSSSDIYHGEQHPELQRYPHPNKPQDRTYGEEQRPQKSSAVKTDCSYPTVCKDGAEERGQQGDASPFVETVMETLVSKPNHLKLIKEDGFEDIGRGCVIKILDSGLVVVKGLEQHVSEVKLKLYDAVEKVKHSSVPLTRGLVQFLQNPKRLSRIEDHLNQEKFSPFVLSLDDDSLKVWTMSQDSADSATKEVKNLLVEDKFKVQKGCQSLLKEHAFSTFLDQVKQDHDVVVEERANSVITCEGFTKDVRAALKELKNYIARNKALRREVTVTASETRYLDRHAQKDLRDIETKVGDSVSIRLNTDKHCIEISSKQETLNDAELKVKDLLVKLCKRDVKLEEPGIGDYFRELGAGLIHAVESKVPCVLDTAAPRQHPGASSRGGGGDRRGHGDKRVDQRSHDNWPNVKIRQGNITESKASVLVNVVGRELNMNRGALSKTFLKVGGDELQAALSKNHTPAEFGQVLITRPRGGLQCEYIYHAVCPAWNPKYGAKTVSDILYKCLTEANKHHSRSIALPSVGAGALGYPTDVLIQAFKTSLGNFFKSSRELELNDISLVIYDGQVYQQFKEAFAGGEISSLSSSPSPSRPKGDNSLNITITATKKNAEEAERLIKRHVKEAYTKDEICNGSLYNPPKALHGLIASLSGPVIIHLDTRSKKISVYGWKTAVDNATKEIFKCLHESKPVAQKPSSVLKSKGVKAYMAAKADEPIYAPGHWKNYNKRDVSVSSYIGGNDDKYKLVDAGKQETDDITKLFQNSWANCSVAVTKVQRVEHPELFQKFATRRQLFFSKAVKGKISIFNPPPITTTFQIQGVDRYCRKEINECLLFHGTRNVSAILDTGLDFRVGASGKFGKGIYMAEAANLSHQFSSAGNFMVPGLMGALSRVVPGGSGKTCMFVVRAVLGNCYSTNTQGGFVRPPCMNSSCGNPTNCLQHGDRYDTVVGTAGGYREFVIYDSAQCYPEYLITL